MASNDLTPEQLNLLHEIFAELNTSYFAGELSRPRFIQSKAFGVFAFYAPVVHMIALNPRTLEQDRKYIADTVLHELVHYALDVRTGDYDQHHG